MHSRHVLHHCVEGMIAGHDHFGVVPDEQVEWILEHLRWHKLLPLAAALSDPAQPKSPRLQQAFEAVQITNIVRERQYRQQAREIIDAFRSASIDVIPYKGPFWGTLMYPAYSWRHIGDLDLLMTNAEARTAAPILKAKGYKPFVVGASEADDFERRGELTFFPAAECQQLVPVQLHWELVPAPRFLKRHFVVHEDFHASTRAANWESITFRLPEPEIQFLYLALHGACQHQFERFVHIMDLVYFIRANPMLDWTRIRQLTHERGCQTPLYYALTFFRAFRALAPAAEELRSSLSPKPHVRIIAGLLRPSETLRATRTRGRRKRKLFRAAMSW